MSINIDVKNGSIALRVFAHKGNWSLNVQVIQGVLASIPIFTVWGFFSFWVVLGNVIILPSTSFCIKYKYVAKRHDFFFPNRY